MKNSLLVEGFVMWGNALGEERRERLRETAFRAGEAGTRCLLEVEEVAWAARELGAGLIGAGVLESTAVAIQAIAFDKSPRANWKVAWHQDLMFPFAEQVHTPGYAIPSVKDGIHFARPPREILEELLAVRIHLDECNESNGPLRVIPGSHRFGVIPGDEISSRVRSSSEHLCTAREGEALLMRPLLLHASSKAAAPAHRRVLHLVFHPGTPVLERWHCAVGINHATQGTAVAITGHGRHERWG